MKMLTEAPVLGVPALGELALEDQVSVNILGTSQKLSL